MKTEWKIVLVNVLSIVLIFGTMPANAGDLFTSDNNIVPPVGETKEKVTDPDIFIDEIGNSEETEGINDIDVIDEDHATAEISAVVDDSSDHNAVVDAVTMDNAVDESAENELVFYDNSTRGEGAVDIDLTALEEIFTDENEPDITTDTSVIHNNLYAFSDDSVPAVEEAQPDTIVFEDGEVISEENSDILMDFFEEESAGSDMNGFSADPGELIPYDMPVGAGTSVKIDETNFPDIIFRQYVSRLFDKNSDGLLSDKEINAVTVIELDNCNISSLQGIQFFKKLDMLKCSENKLTNLDLSAFSSLRELSCSDNQLTSLDLTACKALKYLNCSKNQLTKLDLSKCPDLDNLCCSSNQISELDLSKLSQLTTLYCDNNLLKELDLKNIITLSCSNNQLTNLDVTKCPGLFIFNCSGNYLNEIYVSHCSNLFEFNCYGNRLTSLDVSGLKNLRMLRCNDNRLTNLNIIGCSILFFMSCHNNQIPSIDLLNCPVLLDCIKNGKYGEEGDEYVEYYTEGRDPYMGDIYHAKQIRFSPSTTLITDRTCTKHTWDEGIIWHEPTCLYSGDKKYSCTICKEEKYTIIPPTYKHLWNEGVITTKARKCAPGEKTYTCMNCGETRTEVIPAAVSHTWSSWTVTRKADTNRTGLKKRTCSVCGATETKIIPVIRKSIVNAVVTLSKTRFYFRGKDQKPTVTKVLLNGKLLKSGTDYTVSFPDVSKSVKTYIVKIIGKGLYKGTVEAKYAIVKAKNPMSVITTARTLKYASVKKKSQVITEAISVSKAKGKVSFTKTSGSGNLSVNKTTGYITVKKGTRKGTYKISVNVKAGGNANYKSIEKNVNVSVKVS